MIVKDPKRQLKSLAVAWIYYREAYNMVSHSWIQKCMEVFWVTVNVRFSVNTSIKYLNTELTAGNQRLANVRTKRGISKVIVCCQCCICIGDDTVNMVVKAARGIIRSKNGRWVN